MIIRYINNEDESYIACEEIEHYDYFVQFIDFFYREDGKDITIKDTLYHVEDYEYHAGVDDHLSSLTVYVV